MSDSIGELPFHYWLKQPGLFRYPVIWTNNTKGNNSVDRVFVYALNTVKKLPRSGSARPPPADRLQLYGLYKQSMEGDVDRVMDRPGGEGEEIQAERSRWDAWHQQKGLSRTEAKRRYISTLIETMHKYASTTPDARELVSELEFVWDQIKSNTASSSSSSPMHNSALQGQLPPTYPSASDGGPMRILRPTSQGEDDETNDDQYDDAGDDRPYNAEQPHHGGPRDEVGNTRGYRDGEEETRNRKWRRRVEQALVRMTAEVAALREQLESNRLFGGKRRRSLWDWMLWLVLFTLKHALIDAVFITIALLWMRWKRDKRLEQASAMAVGVVREKARTLKFPKR
ncbi:MAG: hypothetical protein M1835_007663 [Candelina submexicana]|nr:MAG: hypothetical protein M1835_007663 [Candelina submexicana]